MKDSVQNAELSALLLANQPSTTPVGQTNLTNSVEENTEDVRLESDAPITTFHLDQFRSLGDSGSRVVKKDGKVAFTKESNTNPRTIDVQYDKEFGVLSFVRDDQQVVEVAGMPVNASLGIGPEGPRGERGKDGRSGREGDHGKKGMTGCPGPVGPPGKMGPPGPDGPDGERGESGPEGCEGTTGPNGPMGPAGRHGDDGPTGPQHPACFSERGPEGPAGQDAIVVVHLSSSNPGSTVNCCVWGQPE